MNQITSYTPATLYARVSSDRQDVDWTRQRIRRSVAYPLLPVRRT